MHYEGTVIRPPSEADSIILQVTVGCSHNRCTFCGAYKDVRFRLKAPEVIAADLDFASRYCRRQTRLFLADGDVLILPQHRLLQLFAAIRHQLPWVRRISLYGNAKSIRAKSVEQLIELKSLGLHRIYMGLESGHDPTLSRIRKGYDGAAMIAAAEKVRAASIFLSVTALLGIAGRTDSRAHAEATGRVLSAMAPQQAAVLTLMLMPNTPLFQEWQAGNFVLPEPPELLAELRTMVEHLELERTQFQANHASNYLPINARLGRDKERILHEIDLALAGQKALKPERFRAL